MSGDDVIRPAREDSFFVGWEASPPAVDRRFLLGAAGGLVVAGGGAAAVLAGAQGGPGEGSWNQGAVREWTGVLTTSPYPMIQLGAAGSPTRHALLLCSTKCGVEQRLASVGDGPVVVTGSVLERGRSRAIAVADGPDWIRAAPAASGAAATGSRPLGSVTLTGEILDSKCWFGAMRPGEGKTHKACAALCIRFGIPPSFYARDAEGRAHALLMTGPNGEALREAVLPLVADRVTARGALHLIGDDLLTMRVDMDDVARV
ncbi:MAG: hypothetical protein MI723_10075 [Caulobacterales bacterium]|nr:hypothetical protein [Caulobacterales bacterium]